jgi:hypothetical protein
MHPQRKLGLIHFLIGSAVSALMIGFFQWLYTKGYRVTYLGAAWALPGVWALMGVAEMLTGLPFMEMARRWDGMAQWKQTVYGLLLMALGFALICAVIFTVVKLSD